jgi:hypothetical protein
MAYKIMLGDARLFLHGWVSKWDNIVWMAIGYLMHTTCFILDQIINIELHVEKKKKKELKQIYSSWNKDPQFYKLWKHATIVYICPSLLNNF